MTGTAAPGADKDVTLVRLDLDTLAALIRGDLDVASERAGGSLGDGLARL